jgi:hypothetical protein
MKAANIAAWDDMARENRAARVIRDVEGADCLACRRLPQGNQMLRSERPASPGKGQRPIIPPFQGYILRTARPLTLGVAQGFDRAALRASKM